jgi:hypothetical protein
MQQYIIVKIVERRLREVMEKTEAPVEKTRGHGYPLMLYYLTEYPDFYKGDDDFLEGYDDIRIPLSAALYKRPPTTCSTPGKMRPGGYTKTGKYKPAKYIPSKLDKRVGK